MRPRQATQPYDIHILLDGCRGDLLRLLPQTCIDDFNPRIAQGERKNLGAAVVAIQTGLGDQDADPLNCCHAVFALPNGALATEAGRTAAAILATGFPGVKKRRRRSVSESLDRRADAVIQLNGLLGRQKELPADMPWLRIHSDNWRNTTMYVTAVQPFLVDPGTGKNWLFVKVNTDAGISGWGECYTQSDRDQSIVAHVQQLGRYLLGRNAMNIKHFTHMAYHDFAGKRGAMDFYSALSGLEQALSDIVGKHFGTPVYNLLGGACREKIRVYANGWSGGAGTPEEYAERALQIVARGFTALKFDPFPPDRGVPIFRGSRKNRRWKRCAWCGKRLGLTLSC